MLIMRALVTIAISSVWRVISFKGTHIEQRMSLLTLIVLGEGIMVICKAISRVVKVGYIFNGSLIGQIVASVLIICKSARSQFLFA
jgi:low temperature requirement protein LtrA